MGDVTATGVSRLAGLCGLMRGDKSIGRDGLTRFISPIAGRSSVPVGLTGGTIAYGTDRLPSSDGDTGSRKAEVDDSLKWAGLVEPVRRIAPLPLALPGVWGAPNGSAPVGGSGEIGMNRGISGRSRNIGDIDSSSAAFIGSGSLSCCRSFGASCIDSSSKNNESVSCACRT